MFQMLPLLVISLAIYAVLTVTGVGDASDIPWHEAPLVDLPMYSGETFRVTWGVAFLTFSMVLLFVELVRATRTDTTSITNHLLSFLLFIVVLLLFVLMPGYGNATFFLFLTMTFLDPMAGLVVTTVTARRDIGVADKAGATGLI